MKHLRRAAAAILISQTLALPAWAADVLRIGSMPYVPYSAALIAEHHGWVEEELKKLGANDVQVTWRHFNGGPPVNEAFASGNLDIAALGDSPAIAGHASGIKFRITGLMYKGGRAQALIVRTDSPYTSIKDLKGKKVATLRGGNVHELLVLMLEEAGLSLSDIQFINLTLEDMQTALLKGDVDAILPWDPVRTRLEEEKTGRVIRDGGGLKSNFNPIVATETIINDKPQYLQAYSNAVARGADYVRQNPDAAAALLAPQFGLSPQQLVAGFSRSEFVPALVESDKKEFQRSIDYMLKNRLIRNEVDVNTLIKLPEAK
jgi:ABC transporter, substrate-binding protein, aliphatic sulfonates family